MKANEAPEKIYVQLPSRNWIGKTWNETPIKEGDNPNWKNATNIEYIRTDDFINKLECWMNENFFQSAGEFVEGILVQFDRTEDAIDDFRKYMKGE